MENISMTEMSITAIETIIPNTTKGCRAAINTYNDMINDGNYSEYDINLIEEAKERAFKRGQAIQLKINQNEWAGEL